MTACTTAATRPAGLARRPAGRPFFASRPAARCAALTVAATATPPGRAGAGRPRPASEARRVELTAAAATPRPAVASTSAPASTTSTSTPAPPPAPEPTPPDQRLSMSGMAGVQAAGGPNTPPITRTPLSRTLDAPSPAPGTPLMATLLVQCPDAKGVVAALAQVLAVLGCNIVASHQHTDKEAGAFFQRLRFELDPATSLTVLEAAIAGTAARFAMDWALFYDGVGIPKKKVAIFVSKAGHCLWDLLIRAQQGDLPNAEIVAVIANHPDLEPVSKTFGVPFYLIPSSMMGDTEAKAEQERIIEEILAETGADLLVLARFMNVLSTKFCARHAAHTINIHHGFLPAFQGARPYHQAHARGVKLIGSSAHFATAKLDEGPLIAQNIATTSHRDSPADMVRKGRDLERLVLANAVRAVLSDRVLIHGSRTVVFDE